MISPRSLVLALSVVSLVRSQAGSELQVAAHRPVGVSVTVNGSTSTQTGQWVAQVIVHHTDDKKTPSSDWIVEVEPSISSCTGSTKSTRDVKLVMTSPQPSVKVSGYELIPGLNYYKLHNNIATWSAARKVCEDEGGHLVIINSEEEAAAMVKLNGGKGNDGAWVGLRESEKTQGEFFTVFGEPLTSMKFSRWHQGQPDNNSTLGDSLVIDKTSGGLRDLSSTDKQLFICEQYLCRTN